jgi:hypothetical protein
LKEEGCTLLVISEKDKKLLSTSEEQITKAHNQWNVLDETMSQIQEERFGSESESKLIPTLSVTSACPPMNIHKPSQWHDGDFSEIISSDEEKSTMEPMVDKAISQTSVPAKIMKPGLSSQEATVPLSETNSSQHSQRDPLHSEWFSMEFEWSREVAKALKL